VENIKDINDLLGSLCAKGVFTLTELKDITSDNCDNTSWKTKLREVQNLLDHFAGKTAECFDIFLNALDKTSQGHVSTTLRERLTVKGNLL